MSWTAGAMFTFASVMGALEATTPNPNAAVLPIVFAIIGASFQISEAIEARHA